LTISFVIPAHNEDLLIARTLVALREAARSVGEPHEILVVDDASTDRTAAISEAHGARVVHAKHRQISATRNAGARASRGDVLVFVDADTLVSAALVRAALDALRAGAVGGGCTIKFDGPLPAYARVIEPLLVEAFRHASLAAGCFVFCTRDAFDAVGGFDETVYGGEEILMSQALKRHGRFVVLRETVLTSGRKLRAYSASEMFRIMGFLISRGRKSVETRDGLDFWYGPRREDPEAGRPARSA
jgi:glycosyltransferase involved in cell wall biosynthesis